MPSGVRIDAARPDDVAELVRLEAMFPRSDQISPRSWRRFAARPGCVWVARASEGLAGAAVVLTRKGSARARLYSLAVAEHARGGGVARALLEACEAAARSAGRRTLRLEVRPDNTPARALYARAGFRPVGVRAQFYGDGADALILDKPLDEERTSAS